MRPGAASTSALTMCSRCVIPLHDTLPFEFRACCIISSFRNHICTFRACWSCNTKVARK